jgi:hypothetical protein
VLPLVTAVFVLVEHLYTMSTDKSQQRAELLRTVRDALQRAELYCARTRHWDTRLLIISIICGAIATVLAGGTVIGGSRALEAVGGWRILCSIAASDLPSDDALETFQRISEEHAACLA